MSELQHIARRVKLRHLLIGFLVVFGTLPLLISSIAFIARNKGPLEFHERVNLTNRAEAHSRELSDHIGSIRKQLRQLGIGLLTMPDSTRLDSQLRTEWMGQYLGKSLQSNSEFTTRVILPDGQFGPMNLPEAVEAAFNRALQEVLEQRAAAFHFVRLPDSDAPAVVIAEPVFGEPPGESPRYVLEALAELPVQNLAAGEVFLISRQGDILWSDGASEEVLQGVGTSRLVRDHVMVGSSTISVYEYPIRVHGKEQAMIGQLSPVADTGWGVLVQQPKSAAFEVIRKMTNTAVVSVVLVVVLAVGCAPFATRLISKPIQHLAETSKEIASGNFGQRADAGGLGLEISDLAESFNQMSGHVQAHVEQLRQAARANRELFIGSIRAFLTAIEAKEPYTRGHSERVASFSQTIAQHMGLSREFLERIWVAGLLHDVGKIGIEDRILNKGDAFTDEEYEEMKRHPVIGEEIMSSIEQLREMLPAVRWHHEKWNGKGYPDGISGENIPLIARIVAVADTFDAVTTQRVYQDPYTPEDAVESIIKKASGVSFDPRVVKAFVTAFEAGEVRVTSRIRTARPYEAEKTSAVHT